MRPLSTTSYYLSQADKLDTLNMISQFDIQYLAPLSLAGSDQLYLRVAYWALQYRYCN